MPAFANLARLHLDIEMEILSSGELANLTSSFGPAVLWDNVARWVNDNKYVTSAGVSAGTDMAFHLVQRMFGRAVAEAAAIAAEYDWRRDPNEPIFYPQQT